MATARDYYSAFDSYSDDDREDKEYEQFERALKTLRITPSKEKRTVSERKPSEYYRGYDR